MPLMALLAAFALSAGLVPLVRRFAFRVGVVDYPNGRKIHVAPVPLLGGVALFAAVAATLMLFGGSGRQATTVVLGAALFLLLGLLDDVHDIGAVKLLVEFAAATGIVLGTGMVFNLPWRWAEIVLTVFWITGVVNAFNCLDCADGAASSAALAAGGAFLTIAVITGQRFEVLTAAAIIGATAGFLLYNLHPAKIFLGDAGSLVLGYLVAMAGLMLHPGTISVPAMAAPAVILAIPIYDILFVHIRRYAQGQRSLARLLTSTGKDHLPHRLLGRGLSPRRVAFMILLSGALTGAAGVALSAVNTLSGAIGIGAAVLAALVLLERGIRTPRRVPPMLQPSLQKQEGS